MSQYQYNPPAFPFVLNDVYDRRTTAKRSEWEEGMSLREYFAAAALSLHELNCYDRPEEIARKAYEVADRMLEQREKK